MSSSNDTERVIYDYVDLSKGETMRRKKLDLTEEFIMDQIYRETKEYHEDIGQWVISAMAFKVAMDICGTKGLIDVDGFAKVHDQVIDALEHTAQKYLDGEVKNFKERTS